MWDYEDYIDCYEKPSEATIIIDEAVGKLKGLISNHVQEDINSLQAKLEEANKLNEELREQLTEARNKIFGYAQQQGNTVKEYNRAKLTEVIKQASEYEDSWRILRTWEQPNKCEKCDDYRNIKCVSEYGDVAYIKCKCFKSVEVFKVAKCISNLIRLRKYSGKELTYVIKNEESTFGDLVKVNEITEFIPDTEWITGDYYKTEELANQYARDYNNRLINN